METTKFCGDKDLLATAVFRLVGVRQFESGWLIYVQISNVQASGFQIQFKIWAIGKPTSFLQDGILIISLDHFIYIKICLNI